MSTESAQRSKYDHLPTWSSLEVDRERYYSLRFDERIQVFRPTMGGYVRILTEMGPFSVVRDEGGGVFQVRMDPKLYEGQPNNNRPSPGDIVFLTGVATTNKKGDPIVAVHSYELEDHSVPLQVDPADNRLLPFVKAMRSSDERKELLQAHRTPNIIQRFLNQRGYLQIHTPIIEDTDTNLGSRPFFIKDKNELILRRDHDYPTRPYLAAYPLVYQIGPVFRAEGRSTTNRDKEFLYMNAFGVGSYYDAVRLSQDLVKHAIKELSGEDVNIKRMNFMDLVNQELTTEEKKLLVGLDPTERRYQQLVLGVYRRAVKSSDELLLVMGFPITRVPFAQSDDQHPGMAKDFRIVLPGGKTLLHGSQEISSRKEQEERYKLLHGDNFMEKLSEGEIRYLELLGRGMYPFWGVGMGIDRLTQFATNTDNVNSLRPSIV